MPARQTATGVGLTGLKALIRMMTRPAGGIGDEHEGRSQRGQGMVKPFPVSAFEMRGPKLTAQPRVHAHLWLCDSKLKGDHAAHIFPGV